jgi:phosphoribosylformylglycinamidine synthase
MWSLLEAGRGCRDAALQYRTPFVSGKDSLNNEYLGQNGQRESIPPTLLISAIGRIPDVGKTVTLDLKEIHNPLFLVGEFQPTFGGSHFSLTTGAANTQPVPAPSPLAPQVYRALYRAVQAGLIRAAHDLSEGGLAVAASEMAIAGRLGLTLDLPDGELVASLFGETNGCLLVEINQNQVDEFTRLFDELPWRRIGTVSTEPRLTIRHCEQTVLDLPVDALVQAWTR